MGKKISYIILFIIVILSGQTETFAKTILVLDRNNHYVNQIALALFEMDKVTFSYEITSPDWDEFDLLKLYDPDLLILHISCFLNPQNPNDQNFYKKLINLIDFMEPTKTKFLLYSSSPYLRKDKFAKSQVTQIETDVPKLIQQNRVFVFQDPSDKYPALDLRINATKFAFRKLVEELLRY